MNAENNLYHLELSYDLERCRLDLLQTIESVRAVLHIADQNDDPMVPALMPAVFRLQSIGEAFGMLLHPEDHGNMITTSSEQAVSQ